MSAADARTAAADPFDVAIKRENDYLRRLDITVAPPQVAAARRREAAKIRKTTRIKGFRKGKVPIRIVEERYGPLIDERTVDALVNGAFRDAVRRHDLSTIGEPVVSEVDYRPGERLSFRIDVEVMPKVDLARTGGFRVKRRDVDVPDTAIDEVVENFRKEHAVLQPADRQPRSGDVVSVTIREHEGDDDAPAKPYRFELGAGYAIPDVEEAILTLAPGEEGRFTVSYPEDFGSEELAGTTRSLRIHLDDVRTSQLPELTDEFASEVGNFSTLVEFREAIEEELRLRGEREADEEVGEKLVDAVIEANGFEVPPSLLSHYLDRVIDAPEGTDPEQVEEARRSVTPVVERQVKRDLVLERLIEDQDLDLSSEEFDERLSKLAEARGKSVVEIRRQLARDKQLDPLRRRFAIDKAFKFLIDRSDVT
ncbi:trigger factor [Candidatus Palauibacter sp.]|uniref:trigger factor n=1 Tax=Candidatus Palauibacter sp. TaxID=3101350 RepID=UPI003B5CEFC5